jgi:CubicO group peptidase (beta-lactamase class C family)
MAPVPLRRVAVVAAVLVLLCGSLSNANPLDTPATAKLSDAPEAFTQVLAGWVGSHKLKQAVVVVRRGGRVVHRAGIAGGDPHSAYHLASLSKAITGACVATLVRDGRLGFDTALSTALGKFFKAHGRPEDSRLERATIAQLLTHRSGLSSRDDGDDAATGTNLKNYLAGHSPGDPARPDYLVSVLRTKLVRDPGRQFAYSNAGFLILGAIIEEATGRTYEDYCRAAVLSPAGAAGELEPAWRVMSSYGGWRMRGADYLAFLEQLDPAGAKLGPQTIAWMLDRSDKTYGKTSYPVWYGPGIRLRDAGRGIELWHTGSWRRRPPPGAPSRVTGETSTFAMRLADGTSWFVHSLPVALEGARGELDRELLRAYRAVRRWE